jgi:hypothetical protein
MDKHTGKCSNIQNTAARNIKNLSMVGRRSTALSAVISGCASRIAGNMTYTHTHATYKTEHKGDRNSSDFV